MSGNGHSKDLPRSVNIHKDGKIDSDTLQVVLESFKDVMIEVRGDIKMIREKQDEMEKKMKPVISFYRKVLTIVAFCAALFTAYKTGLIDWIKEHIK